jgi:hypothetical protein
MTGVGGIPREPRVVVAIRKTLPRDVDPSL